MTEARRVPVEAREAALAQRHPARDVGVGPLVAAVFAGQVADCGDGVAAEDGLFFAGAHFWRVLAGLGWVEWLVGWCLGVVGVVWAVGLRRGKRVCGNDEGE